MTALPSTRLLRALDVLRIVPPGCLGLVITDKAWTPHLHPGELAVIDTTDQAPQRGELYALRFLTVDGLRTRFVQVGRGLEADAVPISGTPGYGLGVLSDDGWCRKIVGRVVAVIERVGA